MKKKIMNDYKGVEYNFKKIIVEEFENSNDMIKHLKNAVINRSIFTSIESTKGKSDGFNDFDNYEDAEKALEYGTDMYYKDYNKDVKLVKNILSELEKNKNAGYKKDRVGFIPIVPNAIIGNPINMINQDIKKKPSPTAKIIIEKANSCGVDSDDMISFYSIIMTLIELLENRGIRCEIWESAVFREGKEIYAYKLKLKDYQQPLNSFKIQFPIIASDMFRRIGFRLLETNHDIELSSWEDGYGHTIIGRTDGFSLERHGELQKDLIEVLDLNENDIFITNCGSFEHRKNYDKKEEIKKIIRGTNFNKYIKIGE